MMTAKAWVVLPLVLLVAVLLVAKAADQLDQKDAERYIVESETQWAESVSSGDPAPVERILADDFLGVSR